MNPRKLHLVGIGGAGMSGVARLAAQAGYTLSGTDRDDSDVLRALREIGVDARAGHTVDALPADADALVMLARRGLAVAGAHGKSTTSAMLAAALGDASACIGATVPGGGGTGAV